MSAGDWLKTDLYPDRKYTYYLVKVQDFSLVRFEAEGGVTTQGVGKLDHFATVKFYFSVVLNTSFSLI